MVSGKDEIRYNQKPPQICPLNYPNRITLIELVPQEWFLPHGRSSWYKLTTLPCVRKCIIIVVTDKEISFQPREVTAAWAKGSPLLTISSLQSLRSCLSSLLSERLLPSFDQHPPPLCIKVVQRNPSEEEDSHMKNKA